MTGKGLPRSLKNRKEKDRDIVRKTLDLTGKTVTVSATGAAIGFGSAEIGDFAEGNISFKSCVASVGFAGTGSDDNLSDTWSGDFGIGTTAANDATITGTDVNIIPSTAIGTATAEVIDAVKATNVTPAIFDNTDGSLEVNLNLLIDAADITDDESVEITLSGSVVIEYSVMGNA